MKSSNTEALANRRIICTPAAKQGKTYKWSDITCTMFKVDFWSSYRKRLNGDAFDSVVSFDNEQLHFSAEMVGSYKKESSFLGCWEWWAITLLVIGIIVVIALIVFLIVFFATGKKGKKAVVKKSKK